MNDAKKWVSKGVKKKHNVKIEGDAHTYTCAHCIHTDWLD